MNKLIDIYKEDIGTWINTNPEVFFLITLGSIIFISIITIIISNTFKKNNLLYSTKSNSYGKTGAEVAEEILAKNGITDVKVIALRNEGGDHFNPRTKVISLSPSTYSSKSITASAIASHEVGHAIQWHKKEVSIKVRDFLAAPVQAVSQIANIMFSFAFFMLIFGGSEIGTIMTISGLMLFGATSLFQIFTLPVEFGASRKAKQQLKELGYLNSEEEIKGTSKVLSSAAMTYVVAALSSLIFLAIFILKFIALRGNRN